MSVFKADIKVGSATAGNLPPQSVNAGATGAPQATTGYLQGKYLLGSRVVAVCQTGAFSSTPSCAFKISVADDAAGTNVTDTGGVAIATVAAANTVAEAEWSTVNIDPAKFYGIRCTVTGGTSALVAGQLRLLDPRYVA